VIRKVDASTGTISTFAGVNYNYDMHFYTGDGGLKDSAKLYLPASMAIGGNGNMYIADYGNAVVRMIGTVPYSHKRFARGTTQTLHICAGQSNVSVDNMLTVPESSAASETWTLVGQPTYGRVSGLTLTGTVKNGLAVPTGVNYTPQAGYSGYDEFTVETSNGTEKAYTTITVMIDSNVSTSQLAGTSNLIAGSSTMLMPTVGDQGVWSSSNPIVATVDTTGKVTGITAGTTEIQYVVTGNGTCIAQTKKLVVSNTLSSAAAAPSPTSFYPNPSGGTFVCSYYSSEEAGLIITLSDPTGRVIQKQTVSASKGINSFSIQAPADIQKPALLIVSIGDGERVFATQKVTIQ